MKEHEIASVCVYCGSNAGADPAYARGAEAMAAAIAERGLALVYGAGNVGLMGVLADGVVSRGGRAVGFIPRKLADLGLSHAGLSELVVCGTMAERKAAMIERADAFVALPGGIGTLEELAELLTLNQLGYVSKPVGLLDSGGFWRPFVALIEHMVAQGFVKREQADQVVVDDDASRLLDRLAEAKLEYVPKWA